MKKRSLAGWTLAACLAPLQAHALTIADIDLNAFTFDITTYDTGSSPSGVNGDATASGFSGGVAWSISPTSLWSGRTTTNGSFQFAALPQTTDNLHAAGDYTLTFAQPVKTLLVALSNDNTLDAINFGMVPRDVSGVTVSGTQITLNSTQGGLALFENVQSLTIHNINNNGLDDGYDLAFTVIATVPEPATLPMLGLGAAALGLVARRRRNPA